MAGSAVGCAAGEGVRFPARDAEPVHVSDASDAAGAPFDSTRGAPAPVSFALEGAPAGTAGNFSAVGAAAAAVEAASWGIVCGAGGVSLLTPAARSVLGKIESGPV